MYKNIYDKWLDNLDDDNKNVFNDVSSVNVNVKL